MSKNNNGASRHRFVTLAAATAAGARRRVIEDHPAGGCLT